MTKPIHNYTQNAWQGENYELSKDIKDIAKEVRAYVKKNYKEYKFSVRIERYSGGQSMSISLMSGPIDAILGYYSEEWQNDFIVVVKKETPTYIQYNQYHDDYNEEHASLRGGYVIHEKVITMMKDVIGFAQRFNYNDSDGMIDYFNTNFYLHVNIGNWDKPYKNSKKVETANKDFKFRDHPDVVVTNILSKKLYEGITNKNKDETIEDAINILPDFNESWKI